MLYALLAAVSTVLPKITPTATPIPTPTASPTPVPILVSIVKDTTDKPGFWEIAGILSSVLLGVVALIISINAYSFAKKQQQREEDMRQREAKIAVMDKAYEIFDFFATEIHKDDFFSLDDASRRQNCGRIDNIRYKSQMLFKKEITKKIDYEIAVISTILIAHTLPSLDELKKQFNEDKDLLAFDFERFSRSFPSDDFENRKAMTLFFVRKRINKIFEEYRLNL